MRADPCRRSRSKRPANATPHTRPLKYSPRILTRRDRIMLPLARACHDLGKFGCVAFQPARGQRAAFFAVGRLSLRPLDPETNAEVSGVGIWLRPVALAVDSELVGARCMQILFGGRTIPISAWAQFGAVPRPLPIRAPLPRTKNPATVMPARGSSRSYGPERS